MTEREVGREEGYLQALKDLCVYHEHEIDAGGGFEDTAAQRRTLTFLQGLIETKLKRPPYSPQVHPSAKSWGE